MGDGVNIAARLEGHLPAGRDLPLRARLLAGERPARSRGHAISARPNSRTSPSRSASIRLRSASRPGRSPSPAPTAEKSGPPRLSMVVLPFANIGGDPEQEHFVDGVTESLTTDLSRIRGVVRDRAQHGIHLQGQGRRSEADRARVERPLCARGQRSARAETACASTSSSSTPRRAIISGPSGSTSRSPISSTCRTKSSRGWRTR